MYDLITRTVLIKFAAIFVIAGTLGEISVLMFQRILTEPVTVSALVGLVVALGTKIAEIWWTNRKEKRESIKDVLGIETEEKKQLRIEMNKLRAEEKQFANEQLVISKAETFEARMRAHRTANEVMRLQNIILGLQHKIAEHGLEIPEISFTPYHDLLFGTTTEQKELEREMRQLKERMLDHEANVSEQMGKFK